MKLYAEIRQNQSHMTIQTKWKWLPQRGLKEKKRVHLRLQGKVYGLKRQG